MVWKLAEVAIQLSLSHTHTHKDVSGEGANCPPTSQVRFVSFEITGLI